MAEGGIRCTREPSRPRTFEGRRSAPALRAGANLTVRKMAKLFAVRGD